MIGKFLEKLMYFHGIPNMGTSAGREEQNRSDRWEFSCDRRGAVPQKKRRHGIGRGATYTG